MATIIENVKGRRIIRMSTDDVISVVREYQSIVGFPISYDDLRSKLDEREVYIPEDI